jgi:hypothetical protein
MIQSILLVLGVVSIFLLSYPHLMNWGFIVILLAQPVWLYETYIKKQWGIFILAIFYIISAMNGLLNFYKV